MELKRHVELGAQFYVNKYDSPRKIALWVRRFRDTGMKLMRVFLFWDIVEPEDGTWDFTLYDTIFRECEKFGLRIVVTLWNVTPPGWMNITDTFRDMADLDDPWFMEKAYIYIDKVVSRYYESPALDSWIAWKEASRKISPHENSMRAYRKYLKDKFGDIEKLNRIFFNAHKSFDEVGLKPSFCRLEYLPYPETLEWGRFVVRNLCNRLADFREAVRKIDKVHPIHVNAHNVGNNMIDSGQSIWQEAKEIDFLGASNHPFWHAQRFTLDRIHQSIPYFADMIKSATCAPDSYFWITETSGGSSALSCYEYMAPTTSDMNHCIWENLGSGAVKTLFWCINTRNSGNEAGEQSLCSQDGEPTYRLNALIEAQKLIIRNQELFNAARAKKPDVWLLCSENSWQMAKLEGWGEDIHNPRNKCYATDALAGAYLMCADLGLQIQIIDEERFIEGNIPADAILIAPSVVSVENDLCPALERFVKNGGIFIADHIFAFKDPYGRIPDPEYNKAIIDKLFGARLFDILADHSLYKIAGGERSFQSWFLKMVFRMDLGGEVVARFSDDDSPAIVRNSYGKGTAVRIGTTFFQRYFHQIDDDNRMYLKALLPPRAFAGPRLENPGYTLRMKQLDSGDNRILIFFNHGEEVNALFHADMDAQLRSLQDGGIFSVKADSTNVIQLGKGEVALYEMSPRLNQ